MNYEHKSGWISLYSHRGYLLSKKRYNTIWGRKQIIWAWEDFYLGKFYRFYYQIAPDLTTVREKELV